MTCAPYLEIKRKIDQREAPYDALEFDPERDDPSEPPFLDEWLDADMGCRVVGLAAVSMLSDTLKIFFKTLEREFGFRPTAEAKNRLFKNGFLGGYLAILSDIIDTTWQDCPADIGVLEQVTLARNRAQHADDIHDFDVSHETATFKKFPQPLFVGEAYKNTIYDPNDAMTSWFAPDVDVDETSLWKAIGEVEKLADWIIGRENLAREWRGRSN